MTKRLGAFISPGKTLDAAIERVQLAEKLKYETVFSTHIAQRDGLMTLAAYAHATDRIKLGTGVIPAFPRHPVGLAYEAATLDEMSGGRLVLGIGTSHRITMENWYGFDMSKPLSQLREYVAVLRSIITTGGAKHKGDFYNVNFSFMGYAARADLPIYVSGLSPNTLRFAGEAADGLILWACMPRYIADVVVPNVRAGEKAAGRAEGSCEIVAAVPSAVTGDVEATRDAFRGDFFVYMTLPFYRKAIAGAGYADEIGRFDEALAGGDMPGARAAISDAMLEHFAGIGTPSVVRAKIEEYRAAGVTLPAVGLMSGPPGSEGIPESTLEAAAH
ncbi:MAG TPA: LLM class flavin-dependent oxidoreductase [Actinomycetota bacterium]|nr:LLM class flavin-dependent oxidoreductase [Actinomycetota bacterium]